MMAIEGIPFDFARSGFQLVEVPWENRFFNPGTTPFPQGSGRYDDEGVTGASREERVMDGPVVNAGILMTRLDAYIVSGNQVYLDLAIRHAERLALIGYESGGAIYFPYYYNWDLHGFRDFDMEVPWFSAMAQGYILGAYSRLYDVTGEERYLDLAIKTFNSFLRLPGEDQYWTVDLEEGQYLWFEEYARNNGPSDRAFNGHIYATWGLHDYWMVTGDERAIALVDGGLTSLLHFLERWRSPGWQSFYCLTHRERTALYHGVHIGQLAYVYTITAAPIFLQIADIFIDDYPALTRSTIQNPTVHVEAGVYSVAEGGGLEGATRAELAFDEAVDIPWDVRGVVHGSRNASVRISDPSLGQVWLPEIPFEIWVTGKADSVVWHQPLAIALMQDWDGQLHAYDEESDRLTVVEQPVQLEAQVFSSERAKLNGVHCYRIDNGTAQGFWIPRDYVRIQSEG